MGWRPLVPDKLRDGEKEILTRCGGDQGEEKVRRTGAAINYFAAQEGVDEGGRKECGEGG